MIIGVLTSADGRGSGAQGSEEGPDVDAVEGLGEQRRPIRLNAHAGSLQDGGNLVRSDVDS